MKALTLTQPWASLIAKRYKRIETRSWSTPYRGDLAIHAARNLETMVFERYLPYPLPLSAIICIVKLLGCVLMTEDLIRRWRQVYGQREIEMGNFAPGRYAWILGGVRELPTPLKCRGHLGLWDYTVPR
ncbi:MAG: ASCH domain-containing protein [Acidobacteriia bacterium]|nr:ASCH domain-containing protein [Terriglobia bacterium]